MGQFAARGSDESAGRRAFNSSWAARRRARSSVIASSISLRARWSSATLRVSERDKGLITGTSPQVDGSSGAWGSDIGTCRGQPERPGVALTWPNGVSEPAADQPPSVSGLPGTPCIVGAPVPAIDRERSDSANRAGTRDQGEIERGDPARRPVVHGRDRVQRSEAGGEAARGSRIAAAAVGESEGRLLGDRRRSIDLDPVDVVLGPPGPVGGRVGAHPVDVLEADAGLDRRKMPLMVKRMAATAPGSMTPLAVVIGLSVTHFSHVVVIGSSSMPTAWAIIGTVAPHDMIRMSVCSSKGVNSGGRPMPISSS